MFYIYEDFFRSHPLQFLGILAFSRSSQIELKKSFRVFVLFLRLWNSGDIYYFVAKQKMSIFENRQFSEHSFLDLNFCPKNVEKFFANIFFDQRSLFFYY